MKEVTEYMGRFVTAALIATIALMGVGLSTPGLAISCSGAGDLTPFGSAGCTQAGVTGLSVPVSGFPGGAKISLSTDTVSIGHDVNANVGGSRDPSTQSHDTTRPMPVPEPATLILLGGTLVGLGLVSRKFRSKKPESSS